MRFMRFMGFMGFMRAGFEVQGSRFSEGRTPNAERRPPEP